MVFVQLSLEMNLWGYNHQLRWVLAACNQLGRDLVGKRCTLLALRTTPMLLVYLQRVAKGTPSRVVWTWVHRDSRFVVEFKVARSFDWKQIAAFGITHYSRNCRVLTISVNISLGFFLEANRFDFKFATLSLYILANSVSMTWLRSQILVLSRLAADSARTLKEDGSRPCLLYIEALCEQSRGIYMHLRIINCRLCVMLNSRILSRVRTSGCFDVYRPVNIKTETWNDQRTERRDERYAMIRWKDYISCWQELDIYEL